MIPRSEVARVMLAGLATLVVCVALLAGSASLSESERGRLVAALLGFLATLAPRPPSGGSRDSSAPSSSGSSSTSGALHFAKVPRGALAGSLVYAASELAALIGGL